jgi:hypothetical protein
MHGIPHLATTTWTPEREQRLRQFWPQDQKLSILASELRISVPAISWFAKKIGLPPRYNVKRSTVVLTPLAVCNSFPPNEYQYLSQAAAKRKTSVRRLIQNVIVAVARDRMIDAVLDD